MPLIYTPSNRVLDPLNRIHKLSNVITPYPSEKEIELKHNLIAQALYSLINIDNELLYLITPNQKANLINILDHFKLKLNEHYPEYKDKHIPIELISAILTNTREQNHSQSEIYSKLYTPDGKDQKDITLEEILAVRNISVQISNLSIKHWVNYAIYEYGHSIKHSNHAYELISTNLKYFNEIDGPHYYYYNPKFRTLKDTSIAMNCLCHTNPWCTTCPLHPKERNTHCIVPTLYPYLKDSLNLNNENAKMCTSTLLK